jgi:hypothetical protein
LNITSQKRFLKLGYLLWLALICAFTLLHWLHLKADFPNHTIWYSDWAKYTDEGWYGNAAIRAHLFGNWYVPGDFNPAPAVPVWPFLEWLLFFVTGVSLTAGRALAVSFFCINLAFSYRLLRTRGPRWMALLALTLLATSPFLYAFSRLAILEQMLTAFTLAAINLAVRLPRLRRPLLASATIGVLYTLMMLTKTTAAFLAPALAWAVIWPLWHNRKLMVRCALMAAAAFTATFGFWMTLVVLKGWLADYKYLFFINKYVKPPEFYWPLWAFWWSFHGTLWIDRILVPLAGAVLLLAVAAWGARFNSWGRGLLLDPVFGTAFLAVAGYIGFMTYQNHPQPRYFAFVAFFIVFMVVLGAASLAGQSGVLRTASWAVVGIAALAVVWNSWQTINFARHPQYTFVNAARNLAHYIDTHPNGNRLLVSISGDQITMATHLPSLCDDFGTEELVAKLQRYQPGWWATWNDIDPGTLEDLHQHYTLEQVAKFRAFDDPERNVLVLFKLHPLPRGQERDYGAQNLQVPLKGDKIKIPIE